MVIIKKCLKRKGEINNLSSITDFLNPSLASAAEYSRLAKCIGYFLPISRSIKP